MNVSLDSCASISSELCDSLLAGGKAFFIKGYMAELWQVFIDLLILSFCVK